jgi:excisionase family DNA binding protein
MMTTTQAAQKWGVTTVAVRKWIERGKLPGAQKIGRDWLIPVDTQKPVDRRYTKKAED